MNISILTNPARAIFATVLFLITAQLVSAAPAITATQDDNTPAATRKAVGDTITYTTTITNSAPVGAGNDASNLQLTNPTPANTTDAGTVSISPVTLDDTYPQTVIPNIGVNSANIPYSVFSNDFAGSPAVTTIAFFTQPAHGVVTMVTSGANVGQFTYQPAAGYTGADSFTYTLSNAAGSSVGTVSLTVAASPVIWFVNPSAAAGGTGTLSSPFQTAAQAVAAIGNNTGQRIFLYSGNQTTAVTLKNNGWIVGQGVTGTSFDTVMGITPDSGANARPAINGTRPTIGVSSGTGITLASGNTVEGLNVTNSGGAGISGSAVGTLVLADFDVTVTGGTALSLTTSGTVSATGTNNNLTATNSTALNAANVNIAAAGLIFRSISSSGAAYGMSFTSVAAGATGFRVVGDGNGRANGTGGSITNATSEAVHMLTNSGTFTFTSMNFALNTSALDGILVDNNAGSTITANFTGCTFTGVTASTGQNKALLQFEAGGSANVTANVQNTFFNSSKNYGCFATGVGTSILNVTINQCGFGTDVNTGAAINQPGTTITNPPAFSLAVANSSSALVDYTITNNTFWGANGLLGAINAVAISGGGTTASAHLNGSFSFNKIGKTGVTGSGASNNAAGLGLLPGTLGQFHATVIGNDIRQVNNMGINFTNSAGSGANIDATLKCKGNTLAEPDTTGSPNFQRAITVSPGNSAGANNPWTAEIGDTTGSVPANKNTISGPWQAGNFIRITNNNNTATLTLPGLTPATGATAAQVNAFVQGANTFGANATGADVNTSIGTAGIKGGAALPLLFAASEAERNLPGGHDTLASVSDIRASAKGALASADAHPASAQGAALTQSDLDALVAEALARWDTAGLTAEQSALLRGITFEVSDELPSRYLGEAEGRRIRVSSRAAGNGWFVDHRPQGDGQFVKIVAPTRRYSDSLSAPAGRVDLLTAVLHEMGHALGLPDTYAEQDRNNLMYGFLTVAERRLPAVDQAIGVLPRGNLAPHFLLGAVNIGTLPAGKSVKIVYSVTVGPITGNPQQISSQGTVSGSNFTSVTTSDAVAGSGPTNTLLAIPPTFTSANATTFTVGTAGSFSVIANGAPAPTYTVTAGILPTGVTLSAAGVLSGTPAAGTGGTYPVTITASNGIAPNASQSFTLTVNQPAAITSANSTTFTVGTAGSFTVTTSGFPAPALAQGGTLPSGVAFIDNGNGTATLSGTPAAGTGGTYSFTITGANGVGSNATQSFTLTVNEAPSITSANATTFTVGSAGSFTVRKSGFPVPTLSESGALPSGLTFDNATGILSGKPAAGTGGTYAITFTAANGVGSNAVQSFTLTANETAAITSATATTFTVGTAGAFTVTATGFPSPAITIGGNALPFNLAFTDNGNGTASLSGMPAAGTGGVYHLTFTPTGGTPQNFTLTVNEAPTITSANAATFTVGNVGSFTVTKTGFPAPTLSEGGTLPSGITFDSVTGVLSGTPAAGSAGSYPITFTAANGVGTDAVQNFTLTIMDAVCVAPPSDLVAWYPAEGNAIDVQVGHNGSALDGAGYGAGHVGQAFTFDGANSVIQVPDDAAWNFGANAFTIETWVKFNAVTGTDILVGHSSGTGAVNKWIFWLKNGSLSFHLNGSAMANITSDVGFTPALDRWYHVAITRGANTYKFYIDGVQNGTDRFDSNAVPSAAAPLTLGKAEALAAMNGALDEVQIFSRALTAAEIQSVYSAGPEGFCVEALASTAAVSRKMHGAVGTFDVPLPFTGEPGVECRVGSTPGDHTIVVTFNNDVSDGTASVDTGSIVGVPTFSGKAMTVNLTGVPNAQQITVTLSNVKDAFNQVLPTTVVKMNALVGDSTANKVVTASDVSQTKAFSGDPTDVTKFRCDFNTDGAVGASDISQVKAAVGTSLP